jgi:hypothetical protein
MEFLDMIDGKYLFNALYREEVVLDFNKLRDDSVHHMRRYYTCIPKGRNPPGITEYLRYHGYTVKIRQSEYKDEHIVDMAMDIVHFTHVYRDLTIRLITDKTALIRSINLAQEIGAHIFLIGPADSPLRRDCYLYMSLDEFMTTSQLNQPKNFTQDKLESRTWLDLHQDSPSALIKEL